MIIQYRLLKIVDLLARYKSYIILAILVAVTFYFLGHTVAYNSNLTWVYNNRNTTEKLISNFKKTYDKQREISLNYHTAYTDLVNCLIANTSCDAKASEQKQLELSNKRNVLVDELNKLNFENEKIMAKFSLK